MWYISILFALYHSFLPPLVSSNSPTLESIFFLCVCAYMIILVLVFESSFHIWEKTYGLCLLEPGLLHLTWISINLPMNHKISFFFMGEQYSIFSFFVFYYCVGDTLWHLQKELHKIYILKIYQIYHTWIHPLHPSPLSPSSIPGIFSKGLIFPFTYMCT
jgi:hypothetical protein